MIRPCDKLERRSKSSPAGTRSASCAGASREPDGSRPACIPPREVFAFPAPIPPMCAVSIRPYGIRIRGCFLRAVLSARLTGLPRRPSSASRPCLPAANRRASKPTRRLPGGACVALPQQPVPGEARADPRAGVLRPAEDQRSFVPRGRLASEAQGNIFARIDRSAGNSASTSAFVRSTFSQ